MKRTGKIIVIVLLAILGVFVVLAAIYHKAAYMTFRNLTAKKLKLDENDTNWDGGTSYVKVPYAADSDSQYLDLYVPENVEDPKLFVMVHGGGFIAGDSQTRQAQQMYRYFRDHGYACATVNYRLAQEEPFPGGLEDVKAAVRFLKSHARDYGYSIEHVAIWGESAGGYLATMAALTNDEEFMSASYIGQEEDEAAGRQISAKVDVLVDYYGVMELSGLSPMANDWKTLGIPTVVVDIANLWLRTDVIGDYPDVESYWMRKKADDWTEEEAALAGAPYYIAENLNESDLAILIIHGDCDLTVPELQSERLYEQLTSEIGTDRVELWVIPDEGHAADMLYKDDLLDRVKTFIETHVS